LRTTTAVKEGGTQTNREENMKLEEVKIVAKEMGINPGWMRKSELIRAIQRLEGNDACFGIADPRACGQSSCLWREDCLKKPR
jgi:hypothetical protein